MRDRSGQGIKFNRSLITTYLKRTKKVKEFIPCLHLKGISMGEMQPTLEKLLGEGALGFITPAAIVGVSWVVFLRRDAKTKTAYGGQLAIMVILFRIELDAKLFL